MAYNDILSEFSSKDVEAFKKEFTQMIRVGAEIDRYYGEARHDLDTLIPKFEKLVEQFNKKYKGLKIKTKKTIENYNARVFIKVRDVKEFFAECAAKIPGLKSVGRNNFSQINANEAEKFANFLDSPLDKIYMAYSDPESGTSTVAAVYDSREKMIEIAYNPVEMMSESSASFRVCAFYALKNGVDRKIEIYGDSSSFGFMNLLDDIEKREWYDRLNPRVLE